MRSQWKRVFGPRGPPSRNVSARNLKRKQLNHLEGERDESKSNCPKRGRCLGMCCGCFFIYYQWLGVLAVQHKEVFKAFCLA